MKWWPHFVNFIRSHYSRFMCLFQPVLDSILTIFFFSWWLHSPRVMDLSSLPVDSPVHCWIAPLLPWVSHWASSQLWWSWSRFYFVAFDLIVTDPWATAVCQSQNHHLPPPSGSKLKDGRGFLSTSSVHLLPGEKSVVTQYPVSCKVYFAFLAFTTIIWAN